ncbi:MAG: hypothetical protein WCE68_04265 [Anaerolineales bacterium]
MNGQTFPELVFGTRTKPSAQALPERVAAACLQEQFTGPLPLRSERPVAELLRERRAEAGSSSPTPVFIP